MHSATPRILAGLIITLAGTISVQASVFCDIKRTRDGFVALRAEPHPRAPLLQRMRPGDEVMLAVGRQGDWVEVVYWRGGRFANRRTPTNHPPTATGWMHSALLGKDSCG